MQEFLIRLLIVALVIWLVEKFLGTFQVGEPASKVIIVITLIVGVLWLLLGFYYLPLR